MCVRVGLVPVEVEVGDVFFAGDAASEVYRVWLNTFRPPSHSQQGLQSYVQPRVGVRKGVRQVTARGRVFDLRRAHHVSATRVVNVCKYGETLVPIAHPLCLLEQRDRSSGGVLHEPFDYFEANLFYRRRGLRYVKVGKHVRYQSLLGDAIVTVEALA